MMQEWYLQERQAISTRLLAYFSPERNKVCLRDHSAVFLPPRRRALANAVMNLRDLKWQLSQRILTCQE